MKWIELICVIKDPKGFDKAREIFDRFFPQGFVEKDPRLVEAYIASDIWDAHSFHEEIQCDEEMSLTGFVEEDKAQELKGLLMGELQEELVEEGLSEIFFREKLIEDEDWEIAWMENFDVVHCGKRIQIVPSWLVPDIPEDIVIYMDPGTAFGTGDHETTGLCLAYLEEIIQEDMTVFDVGTGTGILAIAARMLGAGRVDAMDFDRAAVKLAAINAAKNNVAITIYENDLLKGVYGQADLIIANIITDVVMTLLKTITESMKENGLALLSGIENNRVDDVCQAAEKEGLEFISLKQGSEWTSLLMRYTKRRVQ